MDSNKMTLAIILECSAIGVFLLNVISIIGVISSNFLKQAAACIFVASLLVNVVCSLVFAIFIAPTFLANTYFYPEFVYAIADCLGTAQWTLGACLSLTMSVERLAVLVFPQFASFILKSMPMIIIIFVEFAGSIIGWWILCKNDSQHSLKTVSLTTFEVSFPTTLSYNGDTVNTCSVLGLSLDAIVTVVCVICYFLIYVKLRKLNNASCCLLSERALYRRRQKEVKLAAEFGFSCIIYVANWIIIRLIKPELRNNINFTVMALLLYFQLFHAAVMAGISILFVKEFRTALKKVWKTTVHIRRLSSTVVPAPNHSKDVNPLKINNNLPCH